MTTIKRAPYRRTAASADVARAGARALLPFSAPFRDWYVSRNPGVVTDDAPRRDAEEIALLMQLPIGLVVLGRSGGTPLTLSAEDVADLLVRVRIIGGSADDSVASLQALERWVAFLADTGRWEGTQAEAEDMRQALLRSSRDAEGTASPAETLRRSVTEVDPRRLQEWTASSDFARTGDSLLNRVRAGGAGYGDLMTLDFLAVLASTTAGDGTAAIVVRGDFCQVFQRAGVIRGHRADVVQVGPRASAWERPGPARERLCVEVGLAFLRSWQERVVRSGEEADLYQDDLYEREEVESPLAAFLPVLLAMVATGHAVLRSEHLEEDVRAVFLRIHPDVDNDQVWSTLDFLLGLQMIGVLRDEGELVLVNEPWFPALSLFVDEHEKHLSVNDSASPGWWV